ncbi:MAG: hypothetical protein HDT39_12620 [Lachnospiraceae bacterium]|nr:hypothetical protein [Lachnospiraceae bacterium]
MKKTIFKLTAFAAILSMIPITTIFAGTHKTESLARRVTYYNAQYLGAVGFYTAMGNAEDGYIVAKTTATNKTNYTKKFFVGVYRYNHSKKKYDKKNHKTFSLNGGQSVYRRIQRDVNSEIYDYYHSADGYAADTTSSYKTDKFEHIAMQYYR